MIAALRGLASVANWVGLEGVLLIGGTACLAVFAETFHPAGAFAVVGVVTVLLGFAVALRAK